MPWAGGFRRAPQSGAGTAPSPDPRLANHPTRRTPRASTHPSPHHAQPPDPALTTLTQLETIWSAKTSHSNTTLGSGDLRATDRATTGDRSTVGERTPDRATASEGGSTVTSDARTTLQDDEADPSLSAVEAAVAGAPSSSAMGGALCAASWRGGAELMGYVVPGCVPSVVMGRHLDEKGMPKQMADELLARLHAGGVRRLVVGHTPHGNCPTVIKAPPDAPGCVDVIMADTSFSDMAAADNRGAAVSEVAVLSTGRVHVRGVLQDAREVDYWLTGGLPRPSELVGKLEPPHEAVMSDLEAGAMPARRFVKAQLTSGEYLMCNVNGFMTSYALLDEETARGLFLGDVGGADLPSVLPSLKLSLSSSKEQVTWPHSQPCQTRASLL